MKNKPKTNGSSVNAATPSLPEMELCGGAKLEKWRKVVGISRTVAWRLRKSGKLPVIVRYGSVYVTAETIRNFFVNDESKPRAFGTKLSPCS